MKTTNRTARLAVFSGVVSMALSAVTGLLPASAVAGTPAGTAIVNQATSAYSDISNNNYTSTSNKVTTTVQSAPTVTVVPQALQTTVPGGQLTDNFTLTNTGNGVGTFTVASTGESGTDGGNATVQAFVVTFPTAITGTYTGCTVLTANSESCSTTGATPVTNLNALLAGNTVASGGVITIGTVYNVSTTATAGTLAAPQTVITNLSATDTYSVANNPGTTAAATSASVPANDTDNVVGDARIDMQKFGIQPNSTSGGFTNTTANIEYVIDSANGGSVPARDLQSVKTLLGSAAAGVFISDKLPAFGGTTAVVQSAAVTTSAAAGYNGTATQLYYSTSATGAAGSWVTFTGTTALPATATFVGVLVSGTPTSELKTNGNATSAGAVTTAQSAVTLTFYVTPPTGTGSGNPNAYVNQADGVVGGGQPNLTPDTAVGNPPQNVVGPNIPANTADSTTAIDSGTQGILYPTPATPGNSTSPNSSNSVGDNAVTAATILNGPFGVPGASGSYNGVVTASQNNDYTAVGFTPNGFVPTNTAASGAPVGNALGAAATVNVPNSIQNDGNTADNITISDTAPAGFTVQIFAATAAGAPTGASLSGAAANTATATFNAVPSGTPAQTTNVVNYVAVYTAPATALAFQPYDAVLTATSGNNGTVTNVTHNDLIPGGPIALSKSVVLDAGTCTGGVAVPGCIVTYNVAYLNNANAASACPATPPTAASIPAYEAGYYSKNLVITENGTTAPNTWGATYTDSTGTHNVTTGLNAAATDTTAGSTFTGNTVGSYNVVDQVGGNATNYVVAPGCSGTFSFKVTVTP